MISVLMSGETGRAKVWDRWLGQSVTGKFPLRQCLGGSDQSATFLTEREGQKATIKLIPAGSANADRQLALWSSAALLSHPHLIRLFDVGRCRLGNSEFIFVVMEYAEENLAQVLPLRALTEVEARDLLEPTLEALAYLHQQGFVHGRLKPSNILAVKEQLKLSSDGLSRPGEPYQGAGKNSACDAPERARGQISPAADVWSLGVTLVEALTQHLPPSNASAEPVVPQKLPEPFREIASACLHRDPRQRATLTAITAKLKRALPAPDQGAPESHDAALRRRLILPIVAAFVIIAVLVADPRFLHRTQKLVPPAPARPEQRKARPKAEQSLTLNAPEPSRVPAKPTPARPQSGDARIAETGNIPPRSGIVARVLPTIPESARKTIEGTLRVTIRVHVDLSGNVASAEFDSVGPSSYFARLAMQAAKKWKFRPAPEPRDWVLRFGFRRTGADVTPVQATR